MERGYAWGRPPWLIRAPGRSQRLLATWEEGAEAHGRKIRGG